MSKVEVLPPNPIDFHLSESAYDNDLYSDPILGGFLPTSNSNSVLTPVLHDNYDNATDDGQNFSIADLPPLLSGHPDLHLRNGVINASCLADANEPDAEKAFFVADLSSVYKQYERWRRLLPGIEPFYGEFPPPVADSVAELTVVVIIQR